MLTAESGVGVLEIDSVKALCLAVVGAFHVAEAVAGAVDVVAPPCAETIQVRAHDAPLAEVLGKISGNLGFRLDAAVDLSERVTVDRKGTPERLLKNLLLGKNLVIQTAPSKACGGKERIQTVWVLPIGQDAPRRAAVEEAQPPREQGAAAAAPPVSQARRHERPRGTRKSMSEEEWQQMKKEYQAGKIKADPETGKPVPVTPEEESAAPVEAE